MNYGQWFRIDGLDARWLERSPANKPARCDRRWNHKVEAQEPRLQLNDGQGPQRARAKGNQPSYLCMSCAADELGLRPPTNPNQGELW